MKEYHNRPDYDVKLYDKDNQPHELRAKVITPDISQELDDIALNKEITGTQRVLCQMVKIFGKDEKFYNKFDLFVMNQVLNDIVNDVLLKKNN